MPTTRIFTFGQGGAVSRPDLNGRREFFDTGSFGLLLAQCQSAGWALDQEQLCPPYQNPGAVRSTEPSPRARYFPVGCSTGRGDPIRVGPCSCGCGRPGSGCAAGDDPLILWCLGGRLLRGLLSSALTRMRRRVVLPMAMPSCSLSNSLRWVWLASSYLVRAK